MDVCFGSIPTWERVCDQWVLMLKTSVTMFAGKGNTNEPDDTKSSIWIRRHFDRPCVWFGLYFISSTLTHAKENCFTTINSQFLAFLFKPLFTWKENKMVYREKRANRNNNKKKIRSCSQFKKRLEQNITHVSSMLVYLRTYILNSLSSIKRPRFTISYNISYGSFFLFYASKSKH